MHHFSVSPVTTIGSVCFVDKHSPPGEALGKNPNSFFRRLHVI